MFSKSFAYFYNSLHISSWILPLWTQMDKVKPYTSWHWSARDWKNLLIRDIGAEQSPSLVMPLYKRTPFALVEPPNGLKLTEHVFQVRFTKEIFREYQAYINRLNLYRQRVWTCKATRRSNLTFEEALVSEHRATEKFQQIPVGYLVPILQMVQYSTLTLKDLTDSIIARLQGYIFEDMELHGRKDQSVCPCKILKIEEPKSSLIVGWLNRNKEVVDTSTVNVDSLIWRKPPISRSLLKSFIRESTFRSAPWVVHEKLADKYGLKMSPPEELRDMINGHDMNKSSYQLKGAEYQMINRKHKQTDVDDVPRKKKMKVLENEEKKTEEPIKYPIDDLLVKPGSDDLVLADRPLLTRDFMIPVHCVGDLFMVWDFCSSFGRVLKLWPFSLDDFEKALCHKDGSLVMIIETHSSLLNALIKDGDYSMVMENKRKSKITLTNWIEYLCDFLEFKKDSELLSHVSIIKRGHYSLLDVPAKLKILHEIVNEVLMTASIRNKLDEYIKGKQILAVARKDDTQSQKEGNYASNEESVVHEINKGNILVFNGANIKSHKGEGDQVEDNSDRYCRDENLLQTDGAQNTQNRCDGKLKVYSRKSLKTPHENGTIIVEEESPSRIVESQKEKQITKEKDGRGQGKKSDEQKKRNLARERQKQFLRTNILGKDRDYNRYWFFHRDGRLLVESPDSKQWGFYTTKEELDAFMASLNPKGVRERSLQKQLHKHYGRISSAMQKRSQEAAQRLLLEEAVLRRSTRVRAQPRDSAATAFLRYTNKWKED